MTASTMDIPGGTPAGLETITGNENLLVLAPVPSDESLGCGGLIAACCRRGRPPFVMVLGDGTGTDPAASGDTGGLANLLERRTRAAVVRLGLPRERLLMAGLYGDDLPNAGPAFEAVVRGVTLVMWARDCNIICAPWPGPDSPDRVRAAYAIAVAVAARSGVGLLAAVGPRGRGAAVPDALCLDISADLAAKCAAVAEHAAPGPAGGQGLAASELYVRPVSPEAPPAP